MDEVEFKSANPEKEEEWKMLRVSAECHSELTKIKGTNSYSETIIELIKRKHKIDTIVECIKLLEIHQRRLNRVETFVSNKSGGQYDFTQDAYKSPLFGNTV